MGPVWPEYIRGARRGPRRPGHRAAGRPGRLPGGHRHLGRPGDLALIAGLLIPGAEPRWAANANLRALDATRFDLKYGMPGLTHDQLMITIELYGQQVIPRVRELLA